MNKPYQIFYKGVLAGCKMTRKAAQSAAFELIKQKGWEATEIEIKESEAK